MAVLFPQPSVGYVLQPNKPSELLQGFLNIQNAEGVNTGKLTQANLASYGMKQFFAVDPSSNVAGYLTRNFAAISKLDGDASSISADDLVQIRSGLPPVQTQPPVTQPPPVNQQNFLQLILSSFQMMLQLMTSLFGGAR